jgi:hypothetical protein
VIEITHYQNDRTSATVTIQTQQSPENETQTAENDWLLAATTSLQVDPSQLTPSHTEVLCGDNDTTTVLQVMGVQNGDWLSAVRGGRFYNNGKYIIGYVDSPSELHQLLQDYQSISGTSFPTIQHLSLSTKPTEDDYLQQRFLTPSARPRLFWQMRAGEPVIHFDGVPFITVGQCTDVHCALSGRRKTTTQLLIATGDVLPTKIHTHGCSAKISIRRILRYPSSRLPDSGIQGITAMRRLRKQVLEVLTAKICAGLVKPVERYYFSLPTPLAHDTHIVPEIEDPPSLIEPIHDEVVRQINQSATSIGHILDHIKKYVEKNYGNNPSINIHDPTFDPDRYQLARYIYWLYKSGRVIDQECPFRERYSLINEDLSDDVGRVEDHSQSDDDISTLYNITINDANQLGLTPPQVGAEEITSTSQVTLANNNKSSSSQRLNKKSLSSSLVAFPRSNVFISPDASLEYAMEESSILTAQQEVQSMLTILENQTYSCKDLKALQTLRRQLTSLCTEFSVHLAGQKRTNSSQSDASNMTTKRPHIDC